MLSSADYRLIRRLEFGHADTGVGCARAYLERFPSSDVAFERVGGGWAVYAGCNSPMTQALAVGMSGTVSPEELGRLKEFYHARGCPAVIDLASMADESVLGLMQQEGLRIREISNVLAREVKPDEPLEASGSVTPAAREEIREWAKLAVQGFTEKEEVSEEEIDAVAATPNHLLAYFGYLEGKRVAAAGMTVFERLATFFGDATIRASRRSGLQLALLQHRLHECARMGCDLASASVLPGSASHRNYERAGFQLIYSRIQIALAI